MQSTSQAPHFTGYGTYLDESSNYDWFGNSAAQHSSTRQPQQPQAEQVHWIHQIKSSIGDPHRTGPPTRCTGYRSDPQVRPSPIEAGFVGSWRDDNLPTWNELSPWFEHRSPPQTPSASSSEIK